MYWLRLKNVCNYQWRRTVLFIRTFNVIIKQCCLIAYCLKCRKYTESKNPSVVKTEKGKIAVFYQTVMFAPENNIDLLKSNKLA